jgi:hypothetical protein
VHFPQFVAVTTTAGHLVWVMRRWLAWHRQLDEEEQLIAQAQQQQPGPSDVDVDTAAMI